MKTVVMLILLISGLVVIYLLPDKPSKLPVVIDEQWSEHVGEEGKISKFKISVPNEVIEDLRSRLKNTRKLTPPLEGVGFQYGFNSKYLESIINYWLNKYDWSKRLDELNSVPHFKARISGLDIHYIHIKPEAKDAKSKKIIPLLLLHGWPGTVKEFYNVFPLLTKARDDYEFIFEVIAPSLPGYGFSDGATKPGLGPVQIGLIMKKLMNALGYDKFYVQGGDWGAIVASNMATLYPDSLYGLHSTMCGTLGPVSSLKILFGTLWPSFIIDSKYQHRLYPLIDKIEFILEEMGYFHLQATKPDTVSVGLQDSPAGLAAYILEKFSTWVDPSWRNLTDGGLTTPEHYTLDDLLDNVMIYWITGSITTSVRLYSEAFSKKQRGLNLDKIPTYVPTVCASYPNELLYIPDSLLYEKSKNLLYVSHLPKGGHFAAFEQPTIFADDVWKAIKVIEEHNYSKELNEKKKLEL